MQRHWLSTTTLLAALLLAGVVHAQSTEEDAALQLYRYRLVQMGMKIRSYPPEALAKGQEGTAVMEIDMDSEGKLERETLLESSGHAVLDSHALDLIARAIPMTEIPSALHNRAFSFRVALVFVLPQ